jgi:hypothetical protein
MKLNTKGILLKHILHFGLTTVSLALSGAADATTSQVFLADEMAQYYITPYATTYDFTIAGGGAGHDTGGLAANTGTAGSTQGNAQPGAGGAGGDAGNSTYDLATASEDGGADGEPR